MSIIIEICRHTMAGRVPCHAPALRHYTYCRHHLRYHPTPAHLVPVEHLPFFPDQLTYLTGVQRLLQAMVNEKIEPKVVNHLLRLNLRAAKLSSWWPKKAAATGPKRLADRRDPSLQFVVNQRGMEKAARQ